MTRKRLPLSGLLLDHLRPSPDALLLDVACGRGRHSRILAGKGFDTTGIDLAENSIAWALQYENDHLHFYRHDMRLPFWINYFDYAFNFFTSFGYFRTEREHSNAIRTISQSLKRTGIFVLDYLNVYRAEESLVPRSEIEIGETHLSYHPVGATTCHFYKQIRIEDAGLAEPLTFTEKIAKFSLSDFSRLFSTHGLQIGESFGDYGLGAFDKRIRPG